MGRFYCFIASHLRCIIAAAASSTETPFETNCGCFLLHPLCLRRNFGISARKRAERKKKFPEAQLSLTRQQERLRKRLSSPNSAGKVARSFYLRKSPPNWMEKINKSWFWGLLRTRTDGGDGQTSIDMEWFPRRKEEERVRWENVGVFDKPLSAFDRRRKEGREAL